MGASAVTSGTVSADGTVPYTGQGFTTDESGSVSVNDERCGLTGQNDANDGGTGQFANWNGAGAPYETGQGYLVWVLTANGATGATLNLPTGAVSMFKVGGTYKYASPYFSVDQIANIVSATYTGKAKGNVQLVVSHGCEPYTQETAAWCSPGYWRNAQDLAWTVSGHAKTDLFNLTVVPDFYDTASAADPTLITVLTTPGANTFGSASAPYGINAFNATAGMLTDSIPGYYFDPALIGAPESCPLDNHGNFKVLVGA